MLKMMKSVIAGGAFAAALLAAAVAYTRWKSAVRKGIRNIPSMEPRFPFGNVSFLAKHGLLQAFQHLTDSYGPVAAMWFFDAQWVVVNRAEDVKTVFASSVYRKPHPVQEIHNHALAGRKSVLFLMNDEWKAHRTALNKAFRVVDIKNMTKDFVAVGAKLCEYLGQCAVNHTAVDLLTALKAATMDIFGRTGFARDFGAVQCLIDGEIPFGITELEFVLKEHARRIVSPNPLLKYYWLPTAANRTFSAHQRKVRELVAGIVEGRLKQQSEHPGSRPHEDLLQFMLEAAREDTSGLITQESLTDSLITVLVAGFDTTSLGLAAAVYLLSQHDRELSKLHGELGRELPSELSEVDADTIARLRYTKAAFEEAMRLFPPVPVTVRTTTSDVTLSTGAVIPADTMVWLCMHLTHRNPEHWPNPDAFNPDRFHVPVGSEDGVPVCGKIPVGAYFPFGLGRRDCAGRNMAMLEGVTLLALITQQFDFTPVDGYKFEPEAQGFMQAPKNGLKVHVSLRQS